MKERETAGRRSKRAKKRRVRRGLWAVEIVSALFLALFIFFLTGSRVRDDVTVANLEEGILKAVSGSAVAWQKADYERLREYYGLDENAYDGVCLYVPASNMDAAELLVLKLREGEQAQDVQSAIEKRLKNQKEKFESYGIEQMGILNRAQIVVKTPYILFAVCDRSEEIKEVFLDTVLE